MSRGGLCGDSGKLEELVHASLEDHVGVLALQETKTIGLELRITQDENRREWQLHTGGPPVPPKIGGTGFLISPEFEVISFVPLSHRVS
jgi:hypothetical protein